MIPLINRTHYSIHRAFSKPREIAQKAKSLGYEAVGLCDFGNVSAALEFIEECKSAKIKPIIGCDFGETYAFCKNLQGWKDLLSVVNEFSIHARLNRDTLANSPHLISFTGKLPDCRYVEKEDEEFYRIMRCLGLKIKLSELTEETAGLHMASPSEIPENPIYEAFDLVEVFEIAAPPKLPKFSDGEVELLWTKVRAGLAQHTKNFDPIKKAEYDARVRYEMKVIELANLSGYFLIVSDFVNKGRADGQLCSIGRGCLGRGNVFVNNSGIKDISNIQIGDSVLCDDGLPHKVIDTMRYRCDENLLKIKTNYGDMDGFTVTKDHKILAIKTHKSRTITRLHEEPRWYQASELAKYDLMVQPKVTSATIGVSRIDLMDFEFSKSNGSKSICDDDFAYTYLTGNRKASSEVIKCNRFIEVNNEFCYMLGVFCGDGWFAAKDQRTHFCFGTEFSGESQGRIISYMESIGCRTTIDEFQSGKRVNQVHFANEAISRAIRSLFPEYEMSAGTKSIPDIIFNQSKERVWNFINGLIESDGSTEGSKHVICTISKKMAYQIKQLLLSIGIASSVRHETRTDERAGFENRKTAYYVQFQDPNTFKIKRYFEVGNNLLVPIRSIEEVEPSGFVYDITVEGRANYLTASGIVHNSSAGCLVSDLIGINLVDPMPYGLLFSRFFNAARAYPKHLSFDEYPFIDEFRDFEAIYLKELETIHAKV